MSLKDLDKGMRMKWVGYSCEDLPAEGLGSGDYMRAELGES